MKQEWRCSRCKTLLGVEQAGKLFLRYKKVHYVVQGAVTAICRTCELVNERSVSVGLARTPAGDGEAEVHA